MSEIPDETIRVPVTSVSTVRPICVLWSPAQNDDGWVTSRSLYVCRVTEDQGAWKQWSHGQGTFPDVACILDPVWERSWSLMDESALIG